MKLPTRSQTRRVKLYSIKNQNQADFCCLICESRSRELIQNECDLRNLVLPPFVTLPLFVNDCIWRSYHMFSEKVHNICEHDGPNSRTPLVRPVHIDPDGASMIVEDWCRFTPTIFSSLCTGSYRLDSHLLSPAVDIWCIVDFTTRLAHRFPVFYLSFLILFPFCLR
jgi:hypothetical protein